MRSVKYLIVLCLLSFICSEELLFEEYAEGSIKKETEDTKTKYNCDAEDKYDKVHCPKIIVTSNIISSIANSYQQVANALRTTSEKTIVDKIIREGFERLHLSSTVKFASKIRDYNGYVKVLKKYIVKQLPTKYNDLFNEALESLEFVKDNYKLSRVNVAFEGDKPENKISSCNFIGGEDENENRYLVIAYMAADFKLAPDLFVWRKSVSVAGGIFSKTKDSFEKVPKSLTKEKVTTMLDCFQWMAFKSMAKFLGIRSINTNEKI